MSVIANAEVSMRDCFFQIVPMFHVLGWGSAHAATMVGAKYVLSGMYSLDRLGELGEILVRELRERLVEKMISLIRYRQNLLSKKIAAEKTTT